LSASLPFSFPTRFSYRYRSRKLQKHCDVLDNRDPEGTTVDRLLSDQHADEDAPILRRLISSHESCSTFRQNTSEVTNAPVDSQLERLRRPLSFMLLYQSLAHL